MEEDYMYMYGIDDGGEEFFFDDGSVADFEPARFCDECGCDIETVWTGAHAFKESCKCGTQHYASMDDYFGVRDYR